MVTQTHRSATEQAGGQSILFTRVEPARSRVSSFSLAYVCEVDAWQASSEHGQAFARTRSCGALILNRLRPVGFASNQQVGVPYPASNERVRVPLIEIQIRSNIEVTSRQVRLNTIPPIRSGMLCFINAKQKPCIKRPSTKVPPKA